MPIHWIVIKLRRKTVTNSRNRAWVLSKIKHCIIADQIILNQITAACYPHLGTYSLKLSKCFAHVFGARSTKSDNFRHGDARCRVVVNPGHLRKNQNHRINFSSVGIVDWLIVLIVSKCWRFASLFIMHAYVPYYERTIVLKMLHELRFSFVQ